MSNDHEIKGGFRRVRRGERGEEGPLEIRIFGGLPDNDPLSPDAPVRRFIGPEGRKVVVHGGLDDDMPNPEPEIPDPLTGKLPSTMNDGEFAEFCTRTNIDPATLRTDIEENERRRQALDQAYARANGSAPSSTEEGELK